MMSTFLNVKSRFVISPRTPNVILLGPKGSVAYVISEGFFVAKNSQDGLNHTIKVNATSVSYDYPDLDKSCYV